MPHYAVGVMGNTEYGVKVSPGTHHHHHQTRDSKRACVQGKALCTKYTTITTRAMHIM